MPTSRLLIYWTLPSAPCCDVSGRLTNWRVTIFREREQRRLDTPEFARVVGIFAREKRSSRHSPRKLEPNRGLNCRSLIGAKVFRLPDTNKDESDWLFLPASNESRLRSRHPPMLVSVESQARS